MSNLYEKYATRSEKLHKLIGMHTVERFFTHTCENGAKWVIMRDGFEHSDRLAEFYYMRNGKKIFIPNTKKLWIENGSAFADDAFYLVFPEYADEMKEVMDAYIIANL